jgi:hypothetical protein
MVVSPRWRREKPRLVLSASDLSLARGYAGTAAGTRPAFVRLGARVGRRLYNIAHSNRDDIQGATTSACPSGSPIRLPSGSPIRRPHERV